MAQYLVTGAAGFIGSNLAQELLQRGERVRGLDDFSSGRRENLVGLDAMDFLEGSIVEPATCKRACAGVDYVLHEAAAPSVPQSVADPLGTDRVNVHGTLQLLLAARDAGVKRFVMANSCAAYGDAPEMPKVETMAATPVSPYGAQKVTGELYLRAFHACYGLPTVGLRYFNVFGPRQDPNGAYAAVVPRFIAALLAGEAPQIFGDGEQSRDFVHVSNVVSANLLACEAPGAPGELFNIGCGQAVRLNELVNTLRELLGANVAPRYLPARTGDILHSLADISKARRVLGYEPRVGTAEGLRRTVDWYRAAHARAA